MRTHTFLWRLVTYRPWLYLANCVLWIVVYLGPVLPGLVLREFFDMLAGTSRYGLGILGLVAVFLGLGAGRLVSIYLGMYADIIHRFCGSALLRRNMMERILQLPGAMQLPEPPGDAISRFRDDGIQAENCVDWTLDLLGSFTFALVALVILGSVNATLTVLVFLPLVIVIGLSRLASERVGKYREASRLATEDVTAALGEVFGAVQAIQVAAAEDSVLRHVQRLNEIRRRAMVRDRVFTRMMQSLYVNTVNVGTGFVLLAAASSMRSGSFTVGDLALFVYYLGFVTDFIQQLGQFITTYQQTGVAVRHMQRLMQGAEPPALVRHQPLYLHGTLPRLYLDVPGRIEPLQVLDVRGLTYRHPESGRGIDGVDLRLPRGSFTVVTGRIGSGKTTLVRALLGLLEKQEGEVRWNDDAVEDQAAFFVPPRSAYVPQVPQLYSSSLRENIALGQEHLDETLLAVLDEAVMTEDLVELPQGLDTLVGPRGVRLSGGQVQRLAAARAFLRSPELLVLDDLSSALDVETEEQLWERLRGQDGNTCLVVSHRHRAFQMADNIVLLEDGRLAGYGPLEELLETSEEMRRIWRGGDDQASATTTSASEGLLA